MINNISHKQADLLKLIYSVMDREVNTLREEYRTLVFDYITEFIYNLHFLNIFQENPLYEQKQFTDKLLILLEKGDRIEDTSVRPFLKKLTDMIGKYLNEDLDAELKRQEKEYYSKLAFNKEERMTTMDLLKQQAFKNINSNK